MSRVTLLFPELLLLLVPLLAIYYWRARVPGLGGVARIVTLTALTFVAAVPLARLGGQGVDVIVVADLSRSMPQDGEARTLEILKLLGEQRRQGDRLGVVTFGRDARIERLPQAFGGIAAFVQEVDRDGSDLAGAIATGVSLIPRDRAGRVIVVSDGEATGASVAAAAHEAAARGVPVDFRGFTRGSAVDIAVESLDLPERVDEREPFQFAASVRTDRTLESEAVLMRDGVEIARKVQTFHPGATQLVFRDVIDRPGVSRYRLQLTASGDRVPENNRGDGAVNVHTPATILLVNATGQPDNLSRALASGKLRVQIATPAELPQDLARYVPFRAAILENVPAGQVGPRALGALSRFANDLGGGLLITGGAASFGVGGYFKSVLDSDLPVSMEIKNEHRKLSLAMVVALDRSGSMAAPAGAGRTKMDLANLGTCAAIETLGPFDEVGVIAVDSAAHVVSPLASAKDKDAICGQVRQIQSLGGGIFTYTALVTAARMVQESEKGTRHIVLFADAADAEEPGEYQRLLATLAPLGITVSVIGLGSETDSDAEFLKDVAARGQGRAFFAATADDLPRLFAQEAITVARSSFINDSTPVRALPDMVLLGELPTSLVPALDGYNLTYLRPGATMGVVTTDEYKAPVLAFWHRGLGRIAALTAEVDGQYARRLNAWSGFQPFAIGLGRWLLGGAPPAGLQASIDRRGAEGIVRLELDPGRTRGGSDDVRTATAAIVPPDARPDHASQPLTLRWTDDDTLEARFAIRNAGVYLGAVRLGTGQVLPLSPLTLPYSPEFEPRADPEQGVRTLREMATISGGVERTDWSGVFTAAGLRRREMRDLVLPLTLAVLVLHLIEIAGRRLLWFGIATARLRALRLPAVTLPIRRRRPLTSSPSPSPQPPVPPRVEPRNAGQSADIGSALGRAKQKARGRMRH